MTTPCPCGYTHGRPLEIGCGKHQCPNRKYDDLVEEILAVAAWDKPWTWQPDRPEYHDGHLHLTHTQWNRILTAHPPGPKHCMAVWGIPVRLIDPTPEQP